MTPPPDLILASQSHGRKTMLQNVGLEFLSMPADLEEEEIVAQMLQQNESPDSIAKSLACKKAEHISQQKPGALVIGSDQILDCNGAILSKAETPEEAKEKLQSLSGQSHKLISAAAIACDGEILWCDVDEATLSMRALSDADLNAYCERAGEALTRSVGAYEIESHGAWLFDRIEGDYFTIMGMPLLKLLQYLKGEHGVYLD